MKGNVRLSKIDIGAKDKREIFSDHTEFMVPAG
jgi:hypothetical protein